MQLACIPEVFQKEEGASGQEPTAPVTHANTPVFFMTVKPTEPSVAWISLPHSQISGLCSLDDSL